MKSHHSRTFSASHKKPSFSSTQSPTSATQPKKDRRESFQPSDIKFNLGTVTKNPSKPLDSKTGNTNVFINNFSVQIKPSNLSTRQNLYSAKNPTAIRQLEKKHSGMVSKGDRLLAESEVPKMQQSGRIMKNADRHSAEKNSHDNDLRDSYTRPKGTPMLGSRGFDLSKSDVPATDFITRFKKGAGEIKKPSASPRYANIALEASLKQSGHVKNKRSFDISSLPSGKKPLFPEHNGKNSGTTNYSTNETDHFVKPKQPSGDNFGHFMYYPSSQSGKPPTPSKGTLTTSVKLDNYLTSKHKRVPSFDVSTKGENMLQKSLEVDIAKLRRSSDSNDLRMSLLEHQEKYTKKMPLRFAVRTRAGATCTGARKTNQDSYIAHSNFGRNANRLFFGVCDGHGTNGHHVSSFVKETLPIYLLADPHLEKQPEVTFTNAFELCHQKLLLCDFDSKFSGTTCATILISGNRIISANAGDSRAVMASFKKDWDYTDLTNDHKPNLLSEAQRILMAGGRIEAFKDQDGNYVGPSRVWLLNQDIPGLAMSRSIGDVLASTVGVTCRPEIKEFQITNYDKFIIVASDGVWEFIDSMEAVSVVAPFYEQNNLEGACDFLLNLAVKRWQEEEENVVDDITLIIIFL